jgi:hypothetical protein
VDESRSYDAPGSPRSGGGSGFGKGDVPVFSRAFFGSSESFSRIGDGEFGGKARGLIFAKDVVGPRFDSGRFPGIQIDIPRSVVLTTDIFDAFIERNSLYDVALSDMPDERICRSRSGRRAFSRTRSSGRLPGSTKRR